MPRSAESLHEYQIAGVEKALAAPGRRWVFNDEMGLGKTAQAIEFCRRIGAERVLVVCPAIVRSAWVREFDKWWPGHPPVGLIFASLDNQALTKKQQDKLTAAYLADIQVVSYNLLGTVSAKNFDVLVIDEAHRCKNPGTSWAKEVRRLASNLAMPVVGLTATLMPNEPIDGCGVVEAIMPGRFGGLDKSGTNINYKCKLRYAQAYPCKYATSGRKFKGLNPLHADELRARLGSLSSRTTKLDVAHLLPAFDVRYWTVPPEGTKQWDVKNFDKGLPWAFKQKWPSIKSWWEDAHAQATHIAILTHLRSTARQIHGKIHAKHNPILITGDMPPEDRNELLERARRQPQATVIATVHSVGIGIDLTFCTAALFAELYYRPETIIQGLGRFSRLSGKVPSSCTILALEGTIDEVIAFKLQEKIQDINRVADAGLSEESLAKGFVDDEAFTQMVHDALTRMYEDEYS